MVDIRSARFDDLPAMLEISNWAALNTPANFAIEPETLDSWEADFLETHERYPWLVAVLESAIVGFAKASPWNGRCAYNWSAEVTVYVHPDLHGRSIGTALYDTFIPLLKAQGYRTLLGGITQPNGASVRLHESFGFRRVALFERIGWKFERWHDVGYWELILSDDDAPPEAIKSVNEVINA